AILTNPITGNAKGDEVLTRAFDHYLRTGQENMDIAELRAQSTTTTGGGYTIPDAPMTRFNEVRAAFGGIRSAAEVLVTSTGAPLPWPTVNDTANTGEIVAEGSTIASGDDVVFGTVNLGAYTYMSGGASNLPLRVPKALLQDASVDISGLVTRLLATRIARAQAAHFATGTGSSQPKGLFFQIADVNTATGNAITYAKLLDLVHALDPEYRHGASFVMNDTTWAAIEGLTDSSTGRPLTMPQAVSSIAGSPASGSLLGFPVIVDQGAPDIANASSTDPGDAGDGFIAFGNIREAYVIRDVAGVEVVVDPYGRAGYGEVQFFATARADATIQNASALALMAGYGA
ncbi:MAG: phage major capsid protein, partial [Acidimicrobiia bacterium]